MAAAAVNSQRMAAPPIPQPKVNLANAIFKVHLLFRFAYSQKVS